MIKAAWISIIIGAFAAGPVHTTPAAAYTIETLQFSATDKFTDVIGVTDSGLFVGNAAKSSSSSSSIFTGSSASGPFTTFNPTGFTNVEAYAVSPTGLVVGNYVSGSKTIGFTYQIGSSPPSGSVGVTTFVPQGATQVNPAGVSSNGYVVGTYQSSTVDDQGFFYNGSTTRILNAPGSTLTIPTAVNSSGTVVGTYQTSAGAVLAFVYSGGTFNAFAVPGAAETNPVAITDSGEIIGYYDDSAGDTFGFTYSSANGFSTFTSSSGLATDVTGADNAGDIIGYDGVTAQGFVDVGGTISALSIPGAVFVDPLAILNADTVVGDFETAKGVTEGFIATSATSVPEPATFVLFGAPAIGMIVGRRARFRGRA
jgi:probable HAF family extracellular repeat protein